MTTATARQESMTAGSASRPPAVDLTAVTKHFGSVHAVRGVDLQLEQGEVVAFLGPNGAGKTSTIDMVLGLSRPDLRQRRGARAAAPPGHRPRPGLRRDADRRPAQGPHCRATPCDTPRACSPTPPRSTRCSRPPGISVIADRQVGKCSGGEQQRLRFAMALLPDPALLVLDEPTTGMDVEGRRGFWEAIRQDADRGRTVLFATHYLEEADAYADRIILLSHGRVVADGTAARSRRCRRAARSGPRCPTPTRPPCERCPAWTASSCAATGLTWHHDSDAVAAGCSPDRARDLEITPAASRRRSSPHQRRRDQTSNTEGAVR